MAGAKMDFGQVEQPELAKHDSSVLDLAFAMDCTGSMGSYIRNAQQSIRHIVEEIVALEHSDVKMALVEFRDHKPQDSTFVTRKHDFTTSIQTMKGWLDACSADGGGDEPEAVADALHDVLGLSWRQDATKICVLIVDAPPHGLGCSGDGFPNGCPAGLDPMSIVGELCQRGVTLYLVGCEPAIRRYKEFYSGMAYITGGQYVPLRNAQLLAQVIIGGAQEEISLEALRVEAEAEVQQAMQCCEADIDEEQLRTKLHSMWKSKGVKTKQLHLNKSALPQASAFAKNMSNLKTMAEVKEEYLNQSLPREESPAPEFGGIRYAAPPAPATSGFFRGLLNKVQGRTESARGKESVPSERSFCSPAPPRVQDPLEDCFENVTEEISEAQTERMIQRAILKNKKS